MKPNVYHPFRNLKELNRCCGRIEEFIEKRWGTLAFANLKKDKTLLIQVQADLDEKDIEEIKEHIRSFIPQELHSRIEVRSGTVWFDVYV